MTYAKHSAEKSAAAAQQCRASRVGTLDRADPAKDEATNVCRNQVGRLERVHVVLRAQTTISEQCRDRTSCERLMFVQMLAATLSLGLWSCDSLLV